MSDGVEIKFSLHPAQMEVYKDPTRFRIVVAGRRFGKSHLAISEASCAALDPANTLHQPVFLIAPTQAQAKMIYWRQLIDELHPVIVNMNVNEGLITLNNGVLIGVKGADNPDALRGPGLWAAFLDELASMKPFVWTDIIRPALTDSKGRAMFIGTPSGRNHFHEMYEYARTAQDPEWKAWHFESIINPFLPAGEIEAARRTMSAASFNKEFRASFATGSGGTFKTEHIKLVDKDENPGDGCWFVAVDLAGFADIEKAMTARQKLLDEHVIVIAKVAMRQVGAERVEEWFVKDVQKGRWGVKETAARIVSAVSETQPTAWGIERGALFNAVMPYIQDEARRRSLDLPAPIPLTHENRIKNERIIWALQGRFEHGRIKFLRAPWNSDAEDQLTQFPSRLVHDDIPDALSYIAQLSQGRVVEDFDDVEDYWKPQDEAIGF